MLEWEFEGKKVQLPQGPLSLKSTVIDAARHYGRVFVEDMVADKNRQLRLAKRHSEAVGASFFKVMHPESGRFLDPRLQESSEGIFQEHGFVGGFSALPAARLRLFELLKKEYPKFLKENQIENVPESYGLFMLGVIQHFSNEVSNSFSDSQLGPTHRAMIRSELSHHVPGPFNMHVTISDWTHSGASEPTQTFRDTSPHHFLNKLNQGAAKFALMGVWPEMLDNPVQKRMKSTQMALELADLAKQYGFRSK